MIGGVATYCSWGVRRLWRGHRTFYVSVAAMSVVAFMSIALDRVASEELTSLIAIQESGELAHATRVLFGLGIALSVLLLQLLMARVLDDRKDEFALMAALGSPTLVISLTVAIEHLLHVMIGAMVGATLSVLLLALAATTASGAAIQSVDTWLLATAVAVALPTVASIPITVVIGWRSARAQLAD